VPEHPRTAPAREQQPVSPADPPGGAGALLVDSHVHLHPCFDLGSVLDHADRNFTQASRQVGAGRWIGALLLAEIEGVDRFRELLELADLQGSVDAWSLEQGEDGASIVSRSDGGHTIVVVAGRQLRVEHRLEVLALCTAKHFPEGHSLAVTARMVREGGGVPVIPWGFGKWWGKRGDHLDRTIHQAEKASFLLGDSGQRLAGASPPTPFARAQQRGIGFVAGSDPLSFRSQEQRVGSYGSILTSRPLDLRRPAEGIRSRLLELDGAPSTFGSRVGPVEFAWAQLRLRLPNACAPAAKPVQRPSAGS